uniref:Uncharacterized protein n=1 Tax=Romanomermis culicivorax TaxID=13658 RepID=A0A915IX31_ROMCU
MLQHVCREKCRRVNRALGDWHARVHAFLPPFDVKGKVALELVVNAKFSTDDDATLALLDVFAASIILSQMSSLLQPKKKHKEYLPDRTKARYHESSFTIAKSRLIASTNDEQQSSSTME